MKKKSISLQQACQDFLQEAEPLQERLLQRQAETHETTSWLQHWWNTAAYLQIRDPVVVYVSYFFQLADDCGARTGIQRGAAALRAAMEYRIQVCSGEKPQDTIGKDDTPLCSAAYKYMFHCCRIPKPHQDSYRIYKPNAYAIVACRNQFFCVPLLDQKTNLLPLSAIERSLKECKEYARQQSHALELGWLTTLNRDDWSHARQELLRIGGGTMQEALQLLESGMLLLCLDDDAPVSYRQRALDYWHGNTNVGGNRWFDKSIQLVASRNGKLGYIGEHSMMDGMPAVGLCQHLLQESYSKQVSVETESPIVPSSGVVSVFEHAFSGLSESDRHKLEILVDEGKSMLSQQCCSYTVFMFLLSLRMSILSLAKKDHAKLVADHELQVESFQGYGSTWIKSAGFSPDAFIQMAIQLATYRLFGKQVGTYESTQVRPFLHGRTEATRSVSLASQAFVECMGLQPGYDDHIPGVRRKKLELFHQAALSHVDYIRKAAQAQGVDRHFFGLSVLVESNEEAPSLFSNPLFIRSKRWRVSSSTLPNMPGFGEVFDDGVGIAYEIKPRCCMFTVTCRSENDWADRLCHLLEEVLLETRLLVELETPPRSKL